MCFREGMRGRWIESEDGQNLSQNHLLSSVSTVVMLYFLLNSVRCSWSFSVHFHFYQNHLMVKNVNRQNFISYMCLTVNILIILLEWN